MINNKFALLDPLTRLPLNNSSRFRVNFSDGKLNLFGIISDATEFKNIDEMLRDKNLFDCSKLEGASWNGLINFNRYLASLNRDITLTNIPYGIFKHLRLMPDVNQKYCLDAVELPILKKQQDSSLEFFSSDKLNKLSINLKDEFLKLESGNEIIGKVNHLCPMRFGTVLDISDLDFRNSNDWFKNNFEEFNYWYDYISFLVTNISLAVDMVHSLSEALQLILTEINMNIRQSEQALSKLIEDFTPDKSTSEMDKISDNIKKSTSDLSANLKKVEEIGNQTLVKYQKLVSDNKINSGEPFYLEINNFYTAYTSLSNLISQIEEIGAGTGESIQKISITSYLKDKLKSVGSQSVSKQLLEEVRDILEIMDPLSEDSWEETQKEFVSQIEQIDKSIFDAIVLIQGFDLLRQVLEHRMAEVKFTLEKFKTQGNNPNWLDIKENVFKMINKTLVTDQEKYSCYFFLPKAVDTTEEKKSPGEVLLF